jgi:hypothetical protein
MRAKLKTDLMSDGGQLGAISSVDRFVTSCIIMAICLPRANHCYDCVVTLQAIELSHELELSPDKLRVRRHDHPEAWPVASATQALASHSNLSADAQEFVPGKRYTGEC